MLVLVVMMMVVVIMNTAVDVADGEEERGL